VKDRILAQYVGKID